MPDDIPEAGRAARGQEPGFVPPESRSRTAALELPPERHATWSKHEIASWLADHGGEAIEFRVLMEELAERLVAAGIPLIRQLCVTQSVHPQFAARGVIWTPEEGALEGLREAGIESTAEYIQSPISVIHSGAAAIRRRLDIDNPQIDFAVLEDLRNDGATDYVAMALPFSDGTRHFISWTTQQPGGFTTEQLSLLHDLLPLICLRVEVDTSYASRRTLLNTYLGKDPAARVLAGTIRKGQSSSVDAVILYSDLRGFTALADRHPPEDVIRVLDLYYAAIAPHISYFNGEILKMIGDGLLAFFPIADTAPEAVSRVACGAMTGTRRALQALDDIPAHELPAGMDKIRAGFALHRGLVAYGNVGADDRLDFTAIGLAVNETTRVEALTKTLGYPLLTTSAFAVHDCGVNLRSLGFHALRGMREPREIFTLPEDAGRVSMPEPAPAPASMWPLPQTPGSRPVR